MGGWWVSDAYAQSPAFLLSWVVLVIGSIVLHELAHGWAAIRCGDRTPIELGRMTPNPIVHMGPMSLIAFALIGFAWGSMPIDPARFRRRHDDALVAFAGPAMNLSIALVSALLLSIWIKAAGGMGVSQTFDQNVRTFFWLGVVLNVALAIFNLVPFPPLDGSRILASYVPRYQQLLMSEQGQTFALIGLLALFYFGGQYLMPIALPIAELIVRIVTI